MKAPTSGEEESKVFDSWREREREAVKAELLIYESSARTSGLPLLQQRPYPILDAGPLAGYDDDLCVASANGVAVAAVCPLSTE